MKAGHSFHLIPLIKSNPLRAIPRFVNDSVFPWCVFQRRLWLRRVGLRRGGLWTGPLPLVRRLVGRGRRGRPLCVWLHLPECAQLSGKVAFKKHSENKIDAICVKNLFTASHNYRHIGTHQRQTCTAVDLFSSVTAAPPQFIRDKHKTL